MFDASEVLFLDTAVDLQLLTPNQRARLLEFQHSLEPGMNATTLVVDAGLMSEEEVQQVLHAIAGRKPKTSGSSLRTAESLGRAPTRAAEQVADPVVNRFGTAVTGSDLRAILDDDDAGGLSEDDLEHLFASLPSPEEPEEVTAEQEVASQSWDADPYGGAPAGKQQAFPMPGGAQPAFPLPEGAAGADQQHWDEHHGQWQAHGQSSDATDSYHEYGDQPDAHPDQATSASIVRSAAAKLDEIDLGSEDEEESDGALARAG